MQVNLLAVEGKDGACTDARAEEAEARAEEAEARAEEAEARAEEAEAVVMP